MDQAGSVWCFNFRKCSHIIYKWENVGKRPFVLFMVLALSGLKIGEGKKIIQPSLRSDEEMIFLHEISL